MTSNFWKQLEGAVLNDKYPLERCLNADDHGAIFLTRLAGAEARPAALKMIRADPGAEGKILWRWSLASALSHRNLIGLYAFERARIQDTAVVYAVMEYAEENLAEVLRQRPLSEAEAGAVLESTVEALAYLHGRGLVHGHIKPANILAARDTIKISSDGLSRAGDAADAAAGRTPHDAPESAATPASPASDVWSLGILVFETLTQRLPGADGSAEEPAQAAIPARFQEVVRHCLRKAPEERWTVAQIAAWLKPAAVSSEPAAAEAPPARSWNRKWVYAAALAVVLLLGLMLTRRSNPPSRAESHPAPAASVVLPSVTSVAPAEDKPSPVPQAEALRASRAQAERAPASTSGSADRSSRSVWRVILYTYNEPFYAQKKTDEINTKWPRLRAEVFTVNAGQPPYLVAVGGRMSREEAVQVLEQARADGLPRDGYVQNYSH